MLQCNELVFCKNSMRSGSLSADMVGLIRFLRHFADTGCHLSCSIAGYEGVYHQTS